ncbi:hypothetical protein [Lacrimispora sp.]|uniref:hypothetical protein n=1 Tax=Lacrimispora sp. TaxID=2719234 RepID=UPI0028A725CA|nr:hypothetical protein [Lacrimispora sp.]
MVRKKYRHISPVEEFESKRQDPPGGRKHDCVRGGFSFFFDINLSVSTVISSIWNTKNAVWNILELLDHSSGILLS